LGYALSTHKAQGSEWPLVVVLADDYAGANFVASREWYYTALSRASKLCITVGRQSTIDRHRRRVSLGERKTFLTDLLDLGRHDDPKA
jgi:exodeoxyribonuclease V alpha subunit